MRFTRYTTPAMLIGTMLLAPLGASAAASKEMQELQRDVAMLSGQMTDLQKAQTATASALQTAVQQLQDSANKTNSNMGSLSTNVLQSVQTALRDVNQQLSSVTGLSVKVGNIEKDVSDLSGSMRELQSSVNKMAQVVSDLSNQVKLLQAPAPAPPPGAEGGTASLPAATAPLASAQTLFTRADSDEGTGKYELALSGFREFLRAYPNDPNAIKAQFHIGSIYYSAGDLDNAVKSFDAVIEQYPKDPTVYPSAYYMKGMALMKQKKNEAARVSFQTVVREFPKSDEAPQASQRLRSLGVTAKKK